MSLTTVVFVHGFNSGPDCWVPFRNLMDPEKNPAERDPDFDPGSYRLLWDFNYCTKWVELNPTRRIPDIDECGNYLGGYLERNVPDGNIILVGHSMGGLVIQSHLAAKIDQKLGFDLARIRTVVLFATPTRGSNLLSVVRAIVDSLFDSPQDEELKPLNREVAAISDQVQKAILGADKVAPDSCPISFQVFWGMADNVVPDVSVRGPFMEAQALPGAHSQILQPDRNKGRSDERYRALKSAILHPVGHPCIYELDRWEVMLSVSPNDPQKPISLSGFAVPVRIETDNTAVRQMSFAFSRQNRCARPWTQKYRSKDGWVQKLSITGENLAGDEEQSEYEETAKKFTYVFKPQIVTNGDPPPVTMKLRIYNGFGVGQRNWHDHLRPDAHCRLYRVTLDLRDYGKAGFVLSQPPALFFLDRGAKDPDLCNELFGEHPHPPLPGSDPWTTTWEFENIRSGVVDLSWDIATANPEHPHRAGDPQ
jgi:pimeloyl-ACP methyl ester carboxylesterase